MRRLRLDLAYDGTDFAGWQVQPGERTVQGVLEDALRRIAGDRPVPVRGAGRTDAGVHARGQVADAAVESAPEDGDLAHALGRILPGDLRVRRVATVAWEFHARIDAVAKTYVYRLDRSRGGDPFSRRYALWWTQRLDVDAVRDALARLPGRRDWSGFTSSACEVGDRVRTVTEARYDEEGTEGTFTFSADGFLTHMVRALVGTALDVGRGRYGPERVDEVLASNDRGRAGPTAPPQGLFLERVLYENAGLRRDG